MRAEATGMTNLVKGFRAFLLRGNVVDLAVAVVIGAAFGALVTAIVGGLITPLIALVIGEPSFEGLTFTIDDTMFFYGTVLNALITFVSIAAAVYFLVVAPINALTARRQAGEVEAERHACPECLSDIPVAARRCAFCTAAVAPVA